MAENEHLPMKRKDIDRVNEEFSDFSLSSPARKIRRLDVDLPPIMEEEETCMAMATEEVESGVVNDERAIVLFNPLHYHQPSSSSSSSSVNLFVDRDLISGFKNRFLRDAASADHNYDEDQTSNECQAVVCWNPSQSLYSQSVGTFQPFQQQRTLEITELDESGEDVVMDEAENETEELSGSTGLPFPQQAQDPTYGFGLPQWQQQQNCLIPQLPQVSTTPTPITWFQ